MQKGYEMIELESDSSPQFILEQIDEYFKKTIFTNLEGDGLKYKISKFNFDDEANISTFELITKGNQKPIKRFIYKLIVTDK